MHRVERLADRPAGGRPERMHPFCSLAPLPEALAQVCGAGVGSKRVDQEYHRLLNKLGPELCILLETPLEEIRRVGGEQLAQGIERMRRGEVDAQAGYDGKYGVIRLFSAAGARGADGSV